MTETINFLPSGKSSSSMDIVQIIGLLLKKKKFIFFSTTACTILAITISLILPEYFKSTSVILPETDKNKLGGLSGLSDLASMAGVGTGDISPIKLYPTILKSESVLKPVIYKKYLSKECNDSINLIQFWKIKAKSPELEYETALTLIRGILDVSMDIKTSVISISLETKEPQISADIINAVTANLDRFMRTKRTTNATKQRQWIELRLAEVQQDLMNSENSLKDFREKNRIIANSPLLLLEQDRLMREVQINGALYAELKKQYELVKIDEIKNTAIISVMDIATPAASKERPKRSIMVITTFFLSLLGSMAYVYLTHLYGKETFALIKRISNYSA